MRRTVMIVGLLTVAACAPAPVPSRPFPTPAATPSIVDPTASITMFRFDVENRSKVSVVVSVATDTAATMPGFRPGESGTISIQLRNPTNGIGVEVLGPPPTCAILATGDFPTPSPFTLVLEDGPRPSEVTLSVRTTTTPSAVPLPSNSLECAGG